MKIVDEDLLEQFRRAGRCEICQRWFYRLQPHHWLPRGMNSCRRLDVPANLIALCVVCHAKAEAVNIPREEILRIIAQREEWHPKLLREELYRLVREENRDEA